MQVRHGLLEVIGSQRLARWAPGSEYLTPSVREQKGVYGEGIGGAPRGFVGLACGRLEVPVQPHFTGGEYAGQRFSRDNPCVPQQRQRNGQIQCREFFELIGGSDVQRECSRDAGQAAAFECGINAGQGAPAGGPWNAADVKSRTPCSVQLNMRHPGVGHGCSVPEGRNQHGRWFTGRVRSGQSTRG